MSYCYTTDDSTIALVGAVGFAPTQHGAPVLQTGSALSLRRAPSKKFEGAKVKGQKIRDEFPRGNRLSFKLSHFLPSHLLPHKLVASPGNAPGHQGYEPRVETSRLAIFPFGKNGRDGRTRTCFPVLPRHVARLLRPRRTLNLENGGGDGTCTRPRCLQGSIAPVAHAPPLVQTSDDRSQTSAQFTNAEA